MKLPKSPMRSQDADRYARHHLIDGFDQDRLQKADLIVVGAGAVGNEVLKNLALLGVGKIEIYDFDLIEENNLTRSILFRAEHIGQSKAVVAAEACCAIDSNVKATAFKGDFRDRLTLERLQASDAVLCCVDNSEARIALNRLCLLARTPLYNAAIDAREVSVEVYPHQLRQAAACYECWIPAAIYEDINQRQSCGGLRKASIEQRRIPTTTLTSSFAGAAMVSLVFQQLCDLPGRRTTSVMARAQLMSLTAVEHAIRHNPACPACETFARDRVILPCRADSPILSGETTTANDPLLRFSEPLLTGWSCTGCGSSAEMFSLVRHYDTSLLWCPRCGAATRTARILDKATASTLATLSAGRRLPLTYLIDETLTPPVVLSVNH